jgi:glyoxylase I family protein
VKDFPRLGHVAMTVVRCDVSRPWYVALFGTEPVLDGGDSDGRHLVWALPGGTFFGIREHSDKTPSSYQFSDVRLGLDHVSFHCPRRAELEEWGRQLDALGYTHGDVVDAPYGSGLSFRDPDGNTLEFFAMPGT